MAKETPHLLLLDEPTNHLDMESIDSLAKAINNFGGGMVLVSHDMRLISQVAKEIWICDNKTVSKYLGEISDFKMHLRRQLQRDSLIEGDGKQVCFFFLSFCFLLHFLLIILMCFLFLDLVVPRQ